MATHVRSAVVVERGMKGGSSIKPGGTAALVPSVGLARRCHGRRFVPLDGGRGSTQTGGEGLAGDSLTVREQEQCEEERAS